MPPLGAAMAILLQNNRFFMRSGGQLYIQANSMIIKRVVPCVDPNIVMDYPITAIIKNTARLIAFSLETAPEGIGRFLLSGCAASSSASNTWLRMLLAAFAMARIKPESRSAGREPTKDRFAALMPIK